jgi:hypothetical protein
MSGETLPRPANASDERGPVARPGRRRSRWRRAAVIVGVLVGGLVAFYSYLAYLGEKRLHDAIAEADALDPGWRLADLEVQRPTVPDEENSVLQIRKVRTLSMGGWDLAIHNALGDGVDSEVQLTPRQLRVLRDELGKLQPALHEARELAGMPVGRTDTPWDANWITAVLTEVQQVRVVASLLSFDILLRCQEGDVETALTDCRAILTASRSLADQPMLIGLLVRIACRAIAVGRLERILAQGEPSESGLAALQQLLEQEEVEPTYLQSVRAERAWADAVAQAAAGGDPAATQMLQGRFTGSPAADRYLGFLLGGSARSNRAALLKYASRAVEIAKLPATERHAEMMKLEAGKELRPWIVRLSAPAYLKTAEADLRSLAQLRTAAAAVAVERFRRAEGRWPQSLTELAPRYLKAVPDDPYDGAPLRYRRLADGVVVYSVGYDGKDDGGNLDRKLSPVAPGRDMGVRLWDVSQRRRPPPAEEPDDPPPGTPW